MPTKAGKQSIKIPNTSEKTVQRSTTIQKPVIKKADPEEIIQRARMNPDSLTHKDVMQLQSTIGNRAVIQLLSKLRPQTEGATIQLKKEEDKSSNTGMPDNLRSGLESLSGVSLSDVRVHRNSDKPGQVGALAYTQGTDIHVAPGQEKHLPHEGWHVVQQKQGRVKPTLQMKTGVLVNDDAGLEKEADVVGSKAANAGAKGRTVQMQKESIIQPKQDAGTVIQLAKAAGSANGKNQFKLHAPKGNDIVYVDENDNATITALVSHGYYIIYKVTLYKDGKTIQVYSDEADTWIRYGGWSYEPNITIPEGKGTLISYMGYHKITAKSSPQYKLKENAQKDNRYSIKKPEYYALIDDRIVIATKPNIGGNFEVSIGDYLDVAFEKNDGSVSTYKCILGDIKGDDAPNPWGHYDGKGVVEIIYHDYKPPAGYNENKNNPWGKGRVIRITKVGKYS